jgi:two-component system OmpR family sensor kinase
MIRRLWFQLVLAFALVTIVSVLTAALVVNMRAGDEFRTFVAQNQVQQLDLIPRLAEYYAAHQDWSGVETVFASIRGMGPGGMGPGGPGMMRGPLALILTDADGRIVYRSTTANMTQGSLGSAELRRAMPVMVQGAPVGYLAAQLQRDTALSSAARLFLDQFNQALIQAGLIAGALGLMSGIIMARRLAAPLNRLAYAAQRLAEGDLTQRAPVAGPSEVAGVAEAFNTMAASLEQAEQARRRLIADIAHELRTPLSVIQGNLRALLDDVFPLEKKKLRPFTMKRCCSVAWLPICVN